MWWNGTAVWWIATRKPGQVVDVTGLLSQSEYLCNILTHGVVVGSDRGNWDLVYVVTESGCTSRSCRMANRGDFNGVSILGFAMATLTIPLAQLVDDARVAK